MSYYYKGEISVFESYSKDIRHLVAYSFEDVPEREYIESNDDSSIVNRIW